MGTNDFVGQGCNLLYPFCAMESPSATARDISQAPHEKNQSVASYWYFSSRKVIHTPYEITNLVWKLNLHKRTWFRADIVEEVVEQFYMLMNSRLSNSPPSKGKCGRILHNFKNHRMLATYFFIKCLYLLNVLLQFYLLISFLGEDYLTHGWDIAKHLWERNEWWTSPRFPLQTSVYHTLSLNSNWKNY